MTPHQETMNKVVSLTTELADLVPSPDDCAKLLALLTALQATYANKCPIV